MVRLLSQSLFAVALCVLGVACTANVIKSGSSLDNRKLDYSYYYYNQSKGTSKKGKQAPKAPKAPKGGKGKGTSKGEPPFYPIYPPEGKGKGGTTVPVPTTPPYGNGKGKGYPNYPPNGSKGSKGKGLPPSYPLYPPPRPPPEGKGKGSMPSGQGKGKGYPIYPPNSSKGGKGKGYVPPPTYGKGKGGTYYVPTPCPTMASNGTAQPNITTTSPGVPTTSTPGIPTSVAPGIPTTATPGTPSFNTFPPGTPVMTPAPALTTNAPVMTPAPVLTTNAPVMVPAPVLTTNAPVVPTVPTVPAVPTVPTVPTAPTVQTATVQATAVEKESTSSSGAKTAGIVLVAGAAAFVLVLGAIFMQRRKRGTPDHERLVDNYDDCHVRTLEGDTLDGTTSMNSEREYPVDEGSEEGGLPSSEWKGLTPYSTEEYRGGRSPLTSGDDEASDNSSGESSGCLRDLDEQ